MGLLESTAELIPLLLLSCFLLLLVLKIFQTSTTSRRTPLPPGPKPKLLIGNLFDIPNDKGHYEYMKWSKEYNSGVVFASALGSNLLVINKRKDAEELLSKRAGLYSDRPVIPTLRLMGWDPDLMAFLRYGDNWRLHRKILQQNFSPTTSMQYRPIIIKKVHRLLKGILEDPREFLYYNKLMIISIPLATMYGYEIDTIHNEFVEAAETSANLAASVIGLGGSIINLIPAFGYIPHWFPGASSHKKIFEIKRLTKMMQTIPMEHVKKQFMDGVAPNSLVSNFLKKKYTVGATKEEEQAIHNIAFTVYGAAADTTIVATDTFFYQMVMNPDIMKKAQEEIDRVVGNHRLPTLKDRQDLPYIEAIYREVMRWKPSLPLGVPHSSLEDDHYNGYFIPKGTTVIANIWAMAHDEQVYPEPFAFKPERFINDEGRLNDDKEPLAYGFGRRICAGRNIASSVVWLTMATVLACFNIAKAKDEDGNEIEINNEYEEFAFIQHKVPFQCSISPRSEIIADLIKDGNEI